MVAASFCLGLSAVGCVAGSDGALEGDDLDPAMEPLGTATSALASTDIVTALDFVIGTGGDDLRSDSVLTAIVFYKNGATSSKNLNDGNGWGNSTTHQVTMPLLSNVHYSDIIGVKLVFDQGGGGINGDNWNMQSLEIFAEDSTNGESFRAFSQVGNPLRRFTGSVTTFGQVSLFPASQ